MAGDPSDRTGSLGDGTSPEPRRHLWSWRLGCGFILVGGLGSAVIAYLGMAGSWGGCESELEPGGRAFINILGIGALFVMPFVAAVTTGLAGAANALLRRSARLRGFRDIASILITLAGVIGLIALISVWIAWGGPPDGYCDRPLG
jgi:hypothetical protein